MIKNKNELKIMDYACAIVNEVLLHLSELVKPGISTLFLDEETNRLCKEKNVIPAFLGYSNYPASVCISINDEVVHGIPKKDKIFKEGDIVSIDFGVLKDGFYGDSAITLGVGKIDFQDYKLMETTKECLKNAIKFCRAGNNLGKVCYAIQTTAEREGYSVIRDFVGHGIGSKLHEPPQIPNYGSPDEGLILEEGMVLAIEPMLCEGDWKVYIDEDGWTVKTLDGKKSAHFESCVAITSNGPIILGNNLF